MVRLHACSKSHPVLRIILSVLFLSPSLSTAVHGATGTSTLSNPTVSFATAGTKQVTFQVCNSYGCTSVTRNVVVLDPMPHILSSSIPVLVGVGQAVPLQDSATGRPPLSHRWIFSNGGADQVVTGAPATWTAPATPGVYAAHLEVINADGSASTVPVTVTVVPSTFVDVPPTYWAWKFIENVYSRGIFAACLASPLSFCPESNVTRGEMASLILRAKMGSAYTPPPCVTPKFSDVPCSDPRAPWVNDLVARGVTAGCGGGNYCPDAPITREQMAVFLLVSKEGAGYSPDTACLSAPFNDVPCYSTFAIWVRELVTRGVTAGCGGGNYCPANTVTRGQMSVFVSTMFNLPPP
jgi:hypothetical protein